MRNMQISCVVLSYNGGDSIIRTLESLREQTYPYKDLVVADDASTDGGKTVSIIEEWIEKNKSYFTEVQFIKNEQNLGIVKNLRNASLHAKGEILFGLGQGDMAYSPDTLELVAKSIEKQINDKVYSEFPLIWLGKIKEFRNTPNREEVELCHSSPYQISLVCKCPDLALMLLAYLGNFISGTTFICSREFYTQETFPWGSFRDIEDYPMLMYMLINQKEIGFLDFYIRWYEDGVGISNSTLPEYKNRMETSWLQINNWLSNLPTSLPSSKRKIVHNMLECRKLSRLQKLLKYPGTVVVTKLYILSKKNKCLQGLILLIGRFYSVFSRLTNSIHSH